MADDRDFPQIVRSRRNRERNGLADDTRIFELDAIPYGQRRSEDAKGAMQHGALTTLALVPPSEFLGYFSTSALILNKMFGTGIFVTPAVVLAITNSKCTSIMLWLFGGLVTWAGLAVYLEYGIRFPLTGGELHYIDHVWARPKLLMTYMYSFMFIVLSGSQANSLTFGKAVIIAATPEGTHIDTRLQKFFAILIIGIVCELQAFSRINYVRFNNLFAIYKITLLTFLTITGWCALAGQRTKAAEALLGPYGLENLRSDFGRTVFTPYNFALALLSIMRVFLGYENANFVLEEVRRPPQDKPRVYRRASKFTVLMISFFYIMINLAFFAAIDTDDMINQSDTLSLFFSKVFGPGRKARRASGIIQTISAAGNIMSYTYANVRVKQEIARLGITPYPEFWARTTRRGTPGPALLLTFVFTSIMILSSPLSDANGYLIISTLFTYARTWVGVFLGLGLLAAPWLESFKFDGQSWRPSNSRTGLKVMVPFTLLFVGTNLYVLVFSWWPANVQKSLQTTSPILPSVVGPIVGTCFLVAGAVYWVWDLHILKALGYTWQVMESEPEDEEVRMLFTRYLDGPALRIFEFGESIYHHLKQAGVCIAERWRTISNHL